MAFKIDDPSSFTFYLIVPMLHVSYFSVVMTFEAYLTKMYPKDIRGMMASCQGIFSIFGSLFYISLSNSLNDHNAKYPFMGVAIMDVLTAIAVVILASVGLFGVPIVMETPEELPTEKSNNHQHLTSQMTIPSEYIDASYKSEQ